jgi:hypothetical protein
MEINALEYAKKIAFSSTETLLFTHSCAQAMKDKEGDYVECGVAAGAQIIAMACAAPNKTVHAFDSFEGIPLPSNRDDQMPGIKMLTEDEIKKLPNAGEQKLKTTGATSFSVEQFRKNIAVLKYSNIEIHKGWFEETMPNNTIDKISILRLDGDLYNSTMVCLKYLFPKVIKGGYVIIDDWELLGCRNACIEYFESIGYSPNYKQVSNIKYFIYGE